MTTMQAGFIGCGNMGSAIAASVARTVGAENIVISDHHPERLGELAQEGARFSDAKGASQAEFIFIGVKPYAVKEALAQAALSPEGDQVIVSMATAVTIEDIQSMLAAMGCPRPVIRIMPNTPTAIGLGMIPYALSSDVSEKQKDKFLFLLQNAGILMPLAEAKINAASAVSGCGPAFVYLFMEAMADGGVSAGLSRAEAEALAEQTVIGAGAMAKKYGNLGKLKDAVCSPGGSTIQGVRSLEKNGLRSSVMEAVLAAYDKTVAMQKKN